jgi:recombination protein RecA
MNQALIITARQKQIIVGKLLGDGHLETQTRGRTYRLKIEHSYHQRKYVNWLYVQLKQLTVSPPRIKYQEIGCKTYMKYWFNTRNSPSLRFYAQQFYRNGRKVIPRLISRWLTPISLAVWFMDDGSVKSHQCRGKIINTQSFDETSLRRLQKALEANFGLRTKLRRQKEGKQIYVPAKEVDKLRRIINPNLIPSMKYKLG